MKNIRFRFFVIALIAIAGITLAGCATNGGRARGDTVTIVNNTGYTVWYVIMSPSFEPEWPAPVEADLLAPDEVLPDGRSVTVRLPFPLSRVDTYDILLIDSDLDGYVQMGVSVTNNMRVVFTFDDFVGSVLE